MAEQMDISIQKAKIIYFMALNKGVLSQKVEDESEDEELSLNPSIAPFISRLESPSGQVGFVQDGNNKFIALERDIAELEPIDSKMKLKPEQMRKIR